MIHTRIVKYAVWFIGAVALYLLAHWQGVGNGSSYIQFVDGALLAYGAGEYIEKRKKVKQFIENHRKLHHRVEQLHEHHLRKEESQI